MSNITNFPNGASSFGVVLYPGAGALPVGGRWWFVDTVNGNDGATGESFDQAKLTVNGVFTDPNFGSLDVIEINGKVREQLVAPLGVYGVTIIGNNTTPRHDLASSWVPPAAPVAATPLLELREQGWVIQNLLMQAPTDAAAVMLHRAESATYPDPSHAQFLGVRFAGGSIGIQDNGGCFNVKVLGCTFQSLTGAAIRTSSTAIAVPLMWEIRGNRFLLCTNGIQVSLNDSQITGNVIEKATTETINTIYASAQGARNFVALNEFNIAAADFDPAGGVTGSATDHWHNYLNDTEEFGVPAN